MKYFGCFVLLIIFAGNSSAWVARGNRHNSANPGKCTINDSVVIAPGESIKDPEQCAQIDCNDAEGNITIRGCGLIAPPPNCEWGELIDKHAPYPMCCKRHLICHDDALNLSKIQIYPKNLRTLQTNVLQKLDSAAATGVNK